jgi:peptidylprolyl isomerase
MAIETDLKAKKGDTVKVHYTGKLSNDTVFDSSDGREPLQFKIGEGSLIAGFEEAVIGMDTGESKTVTLNPEKAYGDHHRELVVEVRRDQFPADLKPEIGQRLTLNMSDQQKAMVTVTEISENAVTLDANHPLAGKDLIFDIKLLEIK